jgi:hypothetical protein
MTTCVHGYSDSPDCKADTPTAKHVESYSEVGHFDDDLTLKEALAMIERLRGHLDREKEAHRATRDVRNDLFTIAAGAWFFIDCVAPPAPKLFEEAWPEWKKWLPQQCKDQLPSTLLK